MIKNMTKEELLNSLKHVTDMSEDKIELVLAKYSKMWIEKGKPKTRFNLRSISNDYSKVLNIVEDMNKNNLMVP